MIVSRRSLLAIGGVSLLARPAVAQQAGMTAVTAYRFSFDALGGGQIKLSDFAQRPILVVNTASFCGFANQFEGLEKLWATLGPRGLAVIGVPSNDFGGQEPGAASETREVATQHGVTFPLAAKTVVAGPNAHPFYRWAASLRPRETPRWNFHKYLVGADGHLAGVFATEVEPEAPPLVLAIQKELAARS
ncbi:glutathione peroxidase [Alsobacter sp. SYSU M60028]|uniref:Glutathione peroxidase n=1 Tax=Alsobacter ponti TaxID=2962936 RepID=A0ABT1L838_9HYPH|nr:glutathione peroxidase [Alsobacter ponti]MCP8937666.1 glutathione peroxidase [Alsobacter ponti]